MHRYVIDVSRIHTLQHLSILCSLAAPRMGDRINIV